MKKVVSLSPAETIDIASDWAKNLTVGSKVSLLGDLGAGKTHFVKGLAQGLGIDATVKSPTYTLVRHYEGQDITLYHFDFYRLEGNEVLDMEQIEHALEDNKGIFVFEWGSRFQDDILKPDFEVTFSLLSATEREIVLP